MGSILIIYISTPSVPAKLTARLEQPLLKRLLRALTFNDECAVVLNLNLTTLPSLPTALYFPRHDTRAAPPRYANMNSEYYPFDWPHLKSLGLPSLKELWIAFKYGSQATA